MASTEMRKTNINDGIKRGRENPIYGRIGLSWKRKKTSGQMTINSTCDGRNFLKFTKTFCRLQNFWFYFSTVWNLWRSPTHPRTCFVFNFKSVLDTFRKNNKVGRKLFCSNSRNVMPSLKNRNKSKWIKKSFCQGIGNCLCSHPTPLHEGVNTHC